MKILTEATNPETLTWLHFYEGEPGRSKHLLSMAVTPDATVDLRHCLQRILRVVKVAGKGGVRDIYIERIP